MKSYKKYIQNMFTLAKESDPKRRADDTLQIEKFLAKATIKLEFTDPVKKYHKYTYAGLKSLSNINWDGYFTKVGLKPNSFGDIIIDNPQFFKTLPELFTKFRIPQLQNYLKWFILHSFYKYLPKEFQQEGNQFFYKILLEEPKPPRRKKIVMDVISSTFRDLLGKYYVEKVFTQEAKDQVIGMAKFLRDAFEERIKKLDWIEEATRTKALKKLNKLNFKIGYPDQWEDYSDLNLGISRSFLYNIRLVVKRLKRRK